MCKITRSGCRQCIHLIWTYFKPPFLYIVGICLDVWAIFSYFSQNAFGIAILYGIIMVVTFTVSTIYNCRINNLLLREEDKTKDVQDMNDFEVNDIQADTRNVKDDSLNIRPEEQQLSSTEENYSSTSYSQKRESYHSPLHSITLIWYLKHFSEAYRNDGKVENEKEYLSDKAILETLESFLGAAPQLTLVLYTTYITGEDPFTPTYIIFKVISLGVLAWSILNYLQSVREEQKSTSITWCNLILPFISTIFQIGSRIFLIVGLAVNTTSGIIIFLACHVVAVYILLKWAANKEQVICEGYSCLMELHRFVYATISIYMYITIADLPRRNTAAVIFYSISIFENIGIAIGITILFKRNLIILIPWLCFFAYIIGVLFTYYYYRKYIKNNPINN